MSTISRFLKDVGLFCERALQTRWSSAKQTYIFKEPTNHSHRIPFGDFTKEYKSLLTRQWIQVNNEYTSWVQVIVDL